MAVKHAISIGSSSVTFAVISNVSTIPVSGARTIPLNNAAMPTTAKLTGWIPAPGNRASAASPKNKPLCAPRTSIGANRPPGVPAAYDAVLSTRRIA